MKDYKSILTEGEFNELLGELERGRKAFSFQLLTSGSDPYSCQIVGIAFSLRPGHARYIPLNQDFTESNKKLDSEYVFGRLKPYFEGYQLKIGHDLKTACKVLGLKGITLFFDALFDLMIVSYVYNLSPKHSLEELCLKLLNRKILSVKDILPKGKGAKKDISQVDLEKVQEYICERVEAAYELKRVIETIHEPVKLAEVYEIELSLIPVLAEMELNGIKVDAEYLTKLSTDWGARLELIAREIYQLAGEEFNINSTKQLGEILFEKLGLPKGKRTKNRYSTDVEELKRLSKKHPLPAEVIKYRELSKLKSTYVDALLSLRNPKTLRIHTSFNQAVTSTGRLSSSNPNLQNIPMRTEEGRKIRRAFIADEADKVILTADYSQIELRVLAHLSKDQQLIEAFQNDDDVHKSTASLIFNRPPTEITTDMREIAKKVNFAVIYGTSKKGLSDSLKVSPSEAQDFIDQYFRIYPGIGDYIKSTHNQARTQGFVATLTGRRRYFPDINSPNLGKREAAERASINAPVQGTAADIIKQAMIDIWYMIGQRQFESKMLLQVHDELVFEIPETEVDQIAPEIKRIMEQALPLDVPVKVNIGRGKNWLEAKDY